MGYREAKAANRVRETYKYKRKPYHHQVAALKTLLSTEWGGALLMDPRTGKTQVSIDYASILHQVGKVNRVLVVCPVSVMGVWEDEIAATCPWPHRTLVWDRYSRRDKEPLPSYGKDVLDFVIVNYDAFSAAGAVVSKDEDGAIIRSKSRGGRYDAKRAIERWGPQLIILDESHRIKTPSARKTTMLWSLSKVAQYRVIATGTAVTKKDRVFDIYSQWKFLHPEGWVSQYTSATFKAEFGRWRQIVTPNTKYDKFLGNQNLPKLRRLIHADSFAVARDECFDLPDNVHVSIPVEITGHAAQVYDDLAEDMVAKLKSGEVTEAQIRLVLNLRFAQTTSGIAKTSPTPAHPKGRLVRIGRDKLNAAADLLGDWFEADEKVVVAARFRADIAGIVAICKKLKVPCFELHGGIPQRERGPAIRSFKVATGAACFVMQPSAGSLGIDLSSASIMLWYSLTQSYVDWKQACDRIALSPRKTTINYLVARGTYDELMMQALQEDRDVVKMVTESPDRLRRSFKSIRDT